MKRVTITIDPGVLRWLDERVKNTRRATRSSEIEDILAEKREREQSEQLLVGGNRICKSIETRENQINDEIVEYGGDYSQG